MSLFDILYLIMLEFQSYIYLLKALRTKYKLPDSPSI